MGRFLGSMAMSAKPVLPAADCARGLPCVMIEIRNDEIADAPGQRKWADLLSGIFADLEPDKGRQEPCGRGIDHPPQPVN